MLFRVSIDVRKARDGIVSESLIRPLPSPPPPCEGGDYGDVVRVLVLFAPVSLLVHRRKYHPNAPSLAKRGRAGEGTPNDKLGVS